MGLLSPVMSFVKLSFGWWPNFAPLELILLLKNAYNTFYIVRTSLWWILIYSLLFFGCVSVQHWSHRINWGRFLFLEFSGCIYIYRTDIVWCGFVFLILWLWLWTTCNLLCSPVLPYAYSDASASWELGRLTWAPFLAVQFFFSVFVGFNSELLLSLELPLWGEFKLQIQVV